MACLVGVEPVVEFVLHQLRGPVGLEEDPWWEVVGVEVAERDGVEGFDEVVEDDLCDSSAVRQARNEDGIVELRRLVQVKLYSLSHLYQWRGYLVVEYGHESGLIGIRLCFFRI